ncbi:putative pyruvate dehydrogenase [Schistosoma mansoni]|uniref:putative pyruvate dehydrogenase n=1 Tax=Schistosoma mansoni TaxID=6183 RepID=UPI00022DC311|nr:putative pyruvate dehydrogenase [Schistosoma mansoni]|eukprot:XP_018648260.1 putative pyruvate dehydrogenase [Schistosoma mansoni]
MTLILDISWDIWLCERKSKGYVEQGDNAKVEFVYVPSHLYHILFELLKNAMRAVVEYHSSADHLPPIKVLIATGQENVTIKVRIIQDDLHLNIKFYVYYNLFINVCVYIVRVDYY